MSIAQYLTRLARGVSAQGVLGPDKGGTGLTGPGITGNVLVSNGTGWVSQAGGVGPTGPTGTAGPTGPAGVDGINMSAILNLGVGDYASIIPYWASGGSGRLYSDHSLFCGYLLG